ncbi:MAG: hypothetical protein GXX91_15270 [Verrucomicrobiaceae bacterium]|nr:hypothetical protein [Verrucomicrobiaceae bacterium]
MRCRGSAAARSGVRRYAADAANFVRTFPLLARFVKRRVHDDNRPFDTLTD